MSQKKVMLGLWNSQAGDLTEYNVTYSTRQ
jgi:hypothetical protein